MPARFALIMVTLTLTFAGCAGPTRSGQEARSLAEDRIGAYQASFLYDQAEQEFIAGQFDRALRNIEQAIAQVPEAAPFHVLQGRVFLETHRLEKAIDSFDTALAQDAACAEAHYFSGIVYQRWSDDERAMDHYWKAYELEQDNVQYLLATAEALVALGEFEEAQRLVEPKLNYFEHNAALRHLLGQLEILQGRPLVAVRLYEEARLLDPDNLMLLEELAWTRYEARLFGECAETVSLLQGKLREERPDLLHLQARCLTLTDQAAEAHAIYSRLTRINGADPTTWIEFGLLAWELGDFRTVAQCGVKAVALAPQRFEGHMLKAIYERHHGRMQAAADLLREACRIASTDASPHILLGRTLEEMGDSNGAMKAYRRALRADEKSLEAHVLIERLEQEAAVASAEQPEE